MRDSHEGLKEAQKAVKSQEEKMETLIENTVKGIYTRIKKAICEPFHPYSEF